MKGIAIIFAAVAAIVLGRPKKRKKGAKRAPEPAAVSPRDAVETAIREASPGDTVDDMANYAYELAYPDCPEDLDPGDPGDDECRALWTELRDVIDEVLADEAQTPESAGCDPLDATTWPAGTICVETSDGFRALPSDWAEGCEGKILEDGEFVCLTDGSIQRISEFISLGSPFAVISEPEGADKGGGWSIEAPGTPEAGADELVIELEAPNPFGAAGVRALYLALYAAEENPDVRVTVDLIVDDLPRAAPSFRVVRLHSGAWEDEVWLPVDDGFDMNLEDALSFAEETY